MLSGVNWLDASGGASAHASSSAGSHAHAAAPGSNGDDMTRQSASFVYRSHLRSGCPSCCVTATATISQSI